MVYDIWMLNIWMISGICCLLRIYWIVIYYNNGGFMLEGY